MTMPAMHMTTRGGVELWLRVSDLMLAQLAVGTLGSVVAVLLRG